MPLCKRDIQARYLCDIGDGWVKFKAICYKVHAADDWTDATHTCTAKQAQLFAPSDQMELDAVSALFDNQSSLWMNAVSADGNLFHTNTNKRVSFLPWKITPPTSSRSRQCVSSMYNSTNNVYSVQPCQKELPFICRKPEGACPLGWLQDDLDCYQLHLRPFERITWSQANINCKQQGSQLIPPTISDDMKTRLNKVLAENGVYSVWLGFSGTNGLYKDVDGHSLGANDGTTVISYNTTDVRGGPQVCGVTDFDPSSNSYLAVYCYTPHSYVCTMKIGTDLVIEETSPYMCPPGWILYEKSCIWISNHSESYPSAGDVCKSMNSTLIQPTSDFTQSVFSTVQFLNTGYREFWIGVKYEQRGSAYVLPSIGSTGEHFSNFSPDETPGPNNRLCVYVTSGASATFIGAWHIDDCTHKRLFVCAAAASKRQALTDVPETFWSAQCRTGWIYSDVTNSCYWVSPYDHKTWEQARTSCQAQQGDLLSISGAEEQAEVQGVLDSLEYSALQHPLWLGARDHTHGAGWGWIDSTPMTFFYWGQAEPRYFSTEGGTCGYIPATANFMWQARSCDHKFGYICEAPALKVNEMRKAPEEEKIDVCSPEALISGEHSVQFSSAFTASSYKDEQHRPEHSRMIHSNSRSWQAGSDLQGEWLAVSLQTPATITSIHTQGDQHIRSYVNSFKVEYQYDATSPWRWLEEDDKTIKIFKADKNTTEVVAATNVTASFIKIWPQTWVGHISMRLELTGCMLERCVGEYSVSGPLVVPDKAITVSSVMSQDYLASAARINKVREDPTDKVDIDNPWMPADDDLHPWIQVDFSKQRIVRGITLYGDDISGKYVTKFKVKMSQSTLHKEAELSSYTQPYGVDYTFDAGSNRSAVTTVYFKSSFSAQVVRVYLSGCSLKGCAMKFDLITCSKGCESEAILANFPHGRLTVSDSDDLLTPDRSRLMTDWSGALKDGWSPRRNTLSGESYIQADLGSVKQVSAVASQGSQSQMAWVKSYYISYSTDGTKFNTYGDVKPQLFTANFDCCTVIKIELDPPVNARYIQLWPQSFHSSIAIRWEVYACPKHSSERPLGCYADDHSDPDLSLQLKPNQYSSTYPDDCLARCYELGFNYAGLQGGDICSCGQKYGTYGKIDGCAVPCKPPYSHLLCGGVDKNLIFSTGKEKSSSVCRPGSVSYGDSCYTVIPTPATWLNARTTCGKFGGRLVEISDSQENTLVTSLLPGKNSAWIGLNDIKKALSFRWTSDYQVYFTRWGFHQPTVNPGLEQRSVAISADGSWSNQFSEKQLPFICKQEKVPSKLPHVTLKDPGCLQGWFGHAANCYQFNRIKKTHTEAHDLCKLDNSNLVQVKTLDENLFLSTVLLEMTDRFWTDVQLDPLTQTFVHQTNGSSTLGYTNWAPYKPDSDGECVSLGTSHQAGVWINERCDASHRFICQLARNGYQTDGSNTGKPQDSVGSCEQGWVEADGLCYQINSVPMNFQLNWHEANKDCQDKGVHLASFHSASQLNSIIQTLELSQLDSESFWIGLTNFDRSTGFEWTDQSVMDFIKWAQQIVSVDNDGRSCGELLGLSAALNMRACQSHRSWICSTKKGSTILTPPVIVFPQPEAFGACNPLPQPWRKFKDNCYFFADGIGGSDDFLTWRQANEECKKVNADLVSIGSKEENLFIHGMLTTSSAIRSVWIGLNQLDRGLGYSWPDGSPLTWSLNWSVNEPNSYGGTQACVEMAVYSGQWNDQHCAVPQGYVCKQPAPGLITPSSKPASAPSTAKHGNCPPGFSKLGSKCYRVFGADSIHNRLTWHEANKACQGLNGVGASGLASITSAVENAMVTTLLREHKVSSWLGLRRTPNGAFIWSNNDTVTWVHWNKHEPNMEENKETCVYMYGPAVDAGKWNDVDCQEQAAYVCQTSTNPVFSSSSPLPSELCRSDLGYHQYGDACFFVETQPVMRPEAEAECMSGMATLATVVDAYDLAHIFLIGHSVDEGIWIGLSDQQTRGHYEWTSGYPVTFTRWASHQPSDEPSTGCIYMDNQGYFNKGPCNQQRGYVCRSDNGPPPEVPTPDNGYCPIQNSVVIGNICFFKQPYVAHFSMAAWLCRTQGARLASFHSPYPDTVTDGGKVWIGLKQSFHGGYSWEDDTPVDFTNWGSGQPDHSGVDKAEKVCVVIETDGTWTTNDCLEKLPFLCSVSKVYPADAPSLPDVIVTPPPVKVPTTHATKIPTKMSSVTSTTSSAISTVSISTTTSSSSSSSSSSPSTTATSSSSTPTKTIVPHLTTPTTTFTTTTQKPSTPHSQYTISASSSTKDGNPTSSQAMETTTYNNGTSKVPKPTLASQESDTKHLSAGDKAAIILGVVVFVLIVLLASFVFIRKRNGQSIFRHSPLRRELSRAKHFETSLYEETHRKQSMLTVEPTTAGTDVMTMEHLSDIIPSRHQPRTGNDSPRVDESAAINDSTSAENITQHGRNIPPGTNRHSKITFDTPDVCPTIMSEIDHSVDVLSLGLDVLHSTDYDNVVSGVPSTANNVAVLPLSSSDDAFAGPLVVTDTHSYENMTADAVPVTPGKSFLLMVEGDSTKYTEAVAMA